MLSGVNWNQNWKNEGLKECRKHMPSLKNKTNWKPNQNEKKIKIK